jgi:coenzyme PQQ precursor peptide PqqA
MATIELDRTMRGFGVGILDRERTIATADLVQERSRFVQERNIGCRPGPQVFDAIFRTCAVSGVVLGSTSAWSSRQISWEDGMTWKTPRIVEVPVGMEINMYACAVRK